MGQSVNQSVRLGRLLLGNPSPYIKTSSPISKYSCLYCPGSLVKGEMIPSIIDSREMGWPSANNPSVGIRCRDQDMGPWESHLTDWPLNEREAWARIGRLVLPCRHRFLTVSVTRQAPRILKNKLKKRKSYGTRKPSFISLGACKVKRSAFALANDRGFKVPNRFNRFFFGV